MSDMTIVLGNKRYSSWSLRPWLALKHTGAAFDEVVIPLYIEGSKEAIRKHSLAGKVPILKHGPVTVWESLAICEYLAERFPAASLWPADPMVRAFARSAATEMHGAYQALRQNLPMDLSRKVDEPARRQAAEADIERVTGLWRECRQRFGSAGANGAGPFLFGGFSIADAMYAPLVCRFRSYTVALDPVCEAYARAILDLPAMREWTEAAAAEPWVLQY
jgi:glutathione S-transferase